MSVEHHNVGAGVLQPNVQISKDRQNKTTIVETYAGAYDDVLGEIPTIGTAHGTYTYATVDRAAFTGEEGDQAKLVITYAGTDNEGSFPEEDDPDPPPAAVYSMDTSTGTEPLLAHPRYTGTGANVFTAGEKELAKQLVGGDETVRDNSDFTDATRAADFIAHYDSGIDAFLAPGVTFKVAYFSATPVSRSVLNLTGRIATATYLPSVTSPRSWLFLGAGQRTEGAGYNIELSYRLSGPRGWDTQLYGSAVQQGV